MSHYICTGGCGGVAEEPGTCQEEVCDLWGEPLTLCECMDGSHAVNEAEGQGEENQQEE